LLTPLYDRLKEKVLIQGYLQADESPVKVLDPLKRGKTHQGYHWVYHSPLEKALFFDYRYSRNRAGPEEVLKDFKGYLQPSSSEQVNSVQNQKLHEQTDGYSAYKKFGHQRDITLVGCMAHARRYFEKGLDNDKSRAEHVLTEIQKLYAFERIAKEKEYSHEERRPYRLDNAQPIMEDLIKWLVREYQIVLPKSPIRVTIGYSHQGIGIFESLSF
jgi:transposase